MSVLATDGRWARRAGVALVAALVMMLARAPARAAELVMFERDGCVFCAAWNRDIAPVYARTNEGRWLPLRRVDLVLPRPAQLAAIGPVQYTPTFVVVEGGREVGRIVGYSGPEPFWGLLGVIARRLAPPG